MLPVFFLIYRLTNRQQMQWLGGRWMMSRFLSSFGRTIISNPTAQWVILLMKTAERVLSRLVYVHFSLITPPLRTRR